jgi:pimeloyl-ACP methyl ester carboxylesterase
MKTVITFLYLLFLVQNAASQAPGIQWQKSLGGTGSESVRQMELTNGGGYILAGTSNANDGDVSGNHGDSDFWIVKTDTAGVIQWQKSLGGSGTDVARSIQQTADSGYIVAGYSNSNDGDVTGHHGAADYDYWVVKLDVNGNLQWQKSLGGSGADGAHAICQINDGSFVVTGYSNSTDGDITGNKGAYDYWVVKLNSNGNIVWEKSVGGSYSEMPYSIASTNDNGFIMAGYSESSDGDASYNHGDGQAFDHWVVKCDTYGNIQWQKSLGGSFADIAYDIKQTKDGGYIVAGHANSTDGDLTGSHGNTDYWVIKLDASGNIKWQKNLGGSLFERAYSIWQTSDNGYIVAGNSSSNDGDIAGNHGDSDYWLIKLEENGKTEWQKTIGGTGSDLAYCIRQTARGEYVITGSSTSSNGDATSNKGGSDIWLVKLAADYALTSIPKLTLSQSVLQAGESLTIKGEDFSGQVNLNISNPLGDTLLIKENIIVISGGKFSYTLVIDSEMIGGEYSVFATELNSGISTAKSRYIVNKTSQTKLWISQPQSYDIYPINQSFQIFWGDFAGNGQSTDATGYCYIKYKIDVSNNNGDSWITLAKDFPVGAIPNINNSGFNYSFTPKIAGTYRIRITETDYPTNTATSEPFAVLAPSTEEGFTYTLEWDESCPKPANMPHPIGLAADGTSRIFIKLARKENNTKPVQNIYARIFPDGGDDSSGPELLGKLQFSTSTTYNLDGNTATGISSTGTYNDDAQKQNIFLLCMIAPDDFTHDLSSQSADRSVKVDFRITYADNTFEVFSTDPYPIHIARPPLFLVHGLNGAPSTYESTRYNLGTGVEFFDGDGKGGVRKNPLWNEVQRLNIFGYETFAKNAEVVLGINIQGDKYYNTFQAFIKAMRKKGYACNKVDYVGHSMGGCVARTIIAHPNYLNGTNNFRNYNKGFINKLITINTPHNGSQIADLAWDRYKESILIEYLNSKNWLPGLKDFFVDGLPSPAVMDLRGNNPEGIKLPKSIVKNHLIGSDIDKLDNLSQSDILSPYLLSYKALYYLLLPPKQTIKEYFSSTYFNEEYLNNSDIVVSHSSQFPGKKESDITDIATFPLAESEASIVYGSDKEHKATPSDLVIGTRVMHLLNASIKSPFFADHIEANTNNKTLRTVPHLMGESEGTDSTTNYFDSSFIQILTPKKRDTLSVSSNVQVQVKIKDTSNLMEIRLIFQSQFYTSISKLNNQFFNVNVSPVPIGKNIMIAQAIYDSAGYIINHIDTITITVIPKDTLRKFIVSPKTNKLNSQQIFEPDFTVVYETYIGTLKNDIDSLQFKILDTNVVRFDSANHRFITKDTGSTYIVFRYKGFSDTAFIFLTMSELFEQTLCPGLMTKTFTAEENIEGNSYQWQVDEGNGFKNIEDDANYSGANTNGLTVTDIPSSWYGYKYQCIISNEIGSTTTTPLTIKFTVKWTGIENSLWENPANWSCGVLPDDNTDVVIPVGVANYPQINANTIVRSLRVSSGARISVLQGALLELKGN